MGNLLKNHAILLIFWCGGIFLSHFASAESPAPSQKVAVYFPEAREPYKTIYQEILDGASSADNIEVVPKVLSNGFDTAEIVEELSSEGISRVIALGREGYKLAKSLPDNVKVVSGALPIRPNGISGISLISDPDKLFSFLEQVAPEVKTVHIAYSESSAWLIGLAEKAAQNHGLVLNAIKVENTGEAIKFYNQLFESSVSKSDAIWLPLDKVSSHDKVTLPLILEKAWAKEIVVFSSKPSHAKRGALFSTYPNNVALGKRLAQMVNSLASSAENKKFSALKSMHLAVNLRTAAHLGLNYTKEQQDAFEVTFPE